MDKCIVCQQEASYGCHGIIKGEVVSFGACPSHRAWNPDHTKPEPSIAEPLNNETKVEARLFEQLVFLGLT